MAEKQIKEKEAPESLNATVKEAEPVKSTKPQTYEVLKPFRNAETKVMQEPGQEITVSDPNRLQKLFDKGILKK